MVKISFPSLSFQGGAAAAEVDEPALSCSGGLPSVEVSDGVSTDGMHANRSV